MDLGPVAPAATTTPAPEAPPVAPAATEAMTAAPAPEAPPAAQPGRLTKFAAMLAAHRERTAVAGPTPGAASGAPSVASPASSSAATRMGLDQETARAARDLKIKTTASPVEIAAAIDHSRANPPRKRARAAPAPAKAPVKVKKEAENDDDEEGREEGEDDEEPEGMTANGLRRIELIGFTPTMVLSKMTAALVHANENIGILYDVAAEHYKCGDDAAALPKRMANLLVKLQKQNVTLEHGCKQLRALIEDLSG